MRSMLKKQRRLEFEEKVSAGASRHHKRELLDKMLKEEAEKEERILLRAFEKIKN